MLLLELCIDNVISVAELKKELETVKQRGNEALKRRDTSEALRLYEEALDISKTIQRTL